MLNFSLAELYIYVYRNHPNLIENLFSNIFKTRTRPSDKNDGENEIYTRIYVSRTD